MTAGEINYFPLDVLAANGGSGNLSDIVKVFSGNEIQLRPEIYGKGSMLGIWRTKGE